MPRLHLNDLNITLRGYAPEAAERLAQELPGAIAFALDHPRQPPRDLSDDIARQVIAGLRAQNEEG